MAKFNLQNKPISNPMLPLEGVLVLEFSQYLAGPYCGLRLADLGARVIKIERPGSGDACRKLVTKNMLRDGDSLVFHTINRNKESYAANLKDPDDLEKVKKLVAQADVITHNFRPGVMDKIGLDFESVKAINPTVIYGEVSGYGRVGPWKDKPGQDLLAQSMSGLNWLSGNREDGPTPFGLAIADMICGTHLAQGILAALVGEAENREALRIEASLIESIVDLQFELFTTHFQDGGRLPKRAAAGNSHAYLAAPYGVYPTKDGHIALAMVKLAQLEELMPLSDLAQFSEQDAFEKRDQIMDTLKQAFVKESTQHWLERFEPADLWCADVFDYAKLMTHPAFEAIQMKQTVSRDNGTEVHTTRCPIRIDGERLFSDRAAPALGRHTQQIDATFIDSK